MSPVRRAGPVGVVSPAAPPPPPAVSGEMFDIFDLTQYAAGKMIPEGDYAVEFIVQEHQSIKAETGQPVGKPRLVVMLVAYPLQGGDPFEQPVSLGTKAILSWVPSPNGKGFVKRAGGPGLPPTNKSNWVYFLDSMVQSGMPADQLRGNDLSAIDGIWIHIQSVPEPEERKGFRKTAATGEAEEEEFRGNGLMPVCTAILEGGKPWEGGGGFEFVNQAKPAAPPARPLAPARRAPVAAAPAPPAAPARTVAPAHRAPVAAAPPPPPPPAEEAGDAGEMTLQEAALEVVGSVLTQPANANGVKIMAMRMAVHSAAVAAFGDQTATDIVNTYFSGSDANLLNLLGAIDYTVKGTGPQREIVPAAK